MTPRILANATFVVDGDRPITAVAVHGGRIQTMGDLDAVRDSVPGTAEVVDLGGAVVFPGFSDSHVHVLNFGRSRMGVSCWPSEVDSVADIIRRVRAAAAADPDPDNRWLRGRGYDPARLAEGRAPTAAELDLEGGRCVMLDSFDFHRRACNTAALAAAGIDHNTPDPAGGFIVRDQHGHPTGELIDSARGLVDPIMPPWSAEEDDRAIQIATDYFASLGFTHVTNAAPLTMSRLGEEIAAFLRLRAAGALRIRFASMLRIDLGTAATDLGLAPGFGDEWFRLGGLKIFADGALGPRTAFVDQPYADGSAVGGMAMPPEELEVMVAPAAAAGWSVCIHAQGDAATRVVARVLRDHPPNQGRVPHRIEHCSLTDADTIATMRDGGITPVPQLGFLRFRSADFARSLGDRRLASIFPLRDWIDAGLHPLHSSDSPVIEDARPMAAIATSIDRSDAEGRRWGPEQAITIQEALAMATRWPAAAAGMDDRGRIEPGYLADFTGFAHDIRTIPPPDLAAVEAVATVVGGDVVWRSDDP